MGKHLVLLDTDPGSDIDDAIAMAYLAKSADVELLGVTTVSGDTQKRAAIARHVLTHYGAPSVPVFAGTSEVLAYGQGQPNVPQFDAIAGEIE
jgi:purine nucleosidase